MIRMQTWLVAHFKHLHLFADRLPCPEGNDGQPERSQIDMLTSLDFTQPTEHLGKEWWQEKENSVPVSRAKIPRRQVQRVEWPIRAKCVNRHSHEWINRIADSSTNERVNSTRTLHDSCSASPHPFFFIQMLKICQKF